MNIVSILCALGKPPYLCFWESTTLFSLDLGPRETKKSLLASKDKPLGVEMR